MSRQTLKNALNVLLTILVIILILGFMTVIAIGAGWGFVSITHNSGFIGAYSVGAITFLIEMAVALSIGHHYQIL